MTRAATSLSQEEYDALVRDAMAFRSQSYAYLTSYSIVQQMLESVIRDLLAEIDKTVPDAAVIAKARAIIARCEEPC